MNGAEWMPENGVYEIILNRLHRSAEQGVLAHAFLVSGATPEVRNAFALDFARMIFSKNEADEKKLTDGNFEDLIYVRRSGNEIVTEQIETLIAALVRKPYYADRIVAVIEDGDYMNITSQNKLLKSLEEPTPGNVILILAQIPGRLAQTIRSRCYPVMLPDVTAVLSPEIYDDAKDILSASLFTNKPMSVIFEKLNKYTAKKNLPKRAEDKLTDMSTDFPVDSSPDAEELLGAMISFIRDLTVGNRAGNLILNRDNAQILERLRPGDDATLRKCMYNIFDAKSALTRNVNKKNCLRNMVIQFRREADYAKSSGRRV